MASLTDSQNYFLLSISVRGGAVGCGTVLKPEGRSFDSRWDHCDFALTSNFLPHHGPRFDRLNP